MTPQPVIAHYRFTAKLGEGGMGEVWRAIDTKLNREVAIKLLPDSFATDTDRLARFAREAQVLASLNHPNIAAIYGVEDRALVMELVEGTELTGPLSDEQALGIIRQLIDALEYAHEKGIVHRDLKPANIKITPEGRLKVLDFGLAKALTSGSAIPSDAASSPTMTFRATMAGVIMGTAGYMSPEQARGQNVDKRADIWSFGVVVYELLTGQRLFEGETVSDALAAVLTRDPGLATVPPRFQRLLRLCLIRDPRQRLRDIGDARMLLDEPPPALPPVKTAKTLWILAALATLTAALLGIALWRAARPIHASPMHLSVDVGEQVLGPTSSFAPILSPDGTRFAYAGNIDGKLQLATRTLDRTKAVALSGTTGATAPFFSPDGRWIGFFADRKLKKVSVDGGAVVTLCEAPSPRGGAWGEDGNIVAELHSHSGLMRISSSGGTPQPLTILRINENSHRWPQILPGGRAVLFTAGYGSGSFDQASIQVQDLRTGQPKTLYEGGSYGRYLSDGHLVFVRQNTLFAAPMDLARLQLTGPVTPIIEQVANKLTEGVAALDVSQTGSVVYASGPGSSNATWSIVWIDSAGNITPLAAPLARYFTPSLSPDGRRLAVSVLNGPNMDIAVYDFQRDVLVKLPSTLGRSRWPTWTPDGRSIIYANSSGDGAANLYCIRSDGSAPGVRITQSENEQTPTSISPDGKYLAYAEFDPRTHSDIWILPLDWSNPDLAKTGKPEIFLQTDKPEFDASFSPDGRWLAYSSAEGEDAQIYVRPFPHSRGGGKVQISTEGGRFPAWSRAGHELFYMWQYHLMTAAYRADRAGFTAERPRPWGRSHSVFELGGMRNYDVAQDGRRALAFFDLEFAASPKTFTHVNFVLNFFEELKRQVP